MRQTCLGSMKINENMFNIARLWATLFGQWAEVVVNSEKHSHMSTVLRQIFNVYNHKHNTTACNKCDTVRQNIDKQKHFVWLGLLSLAKVRVDFPCVKFSYWICCIDIFILFTGLCSQEEERLVRDLFRGYNKLIRPVQNMTQKVKVAFGLAFIQLINVVMYKLSILK